MESGACWYNLNIRHACQFAQVHDVLVGAQLCRGDITAMVAACPVTWRTGLEDVMAFCARAEVPVLVFSAGLAGALEYKADVLM